MTAFRLTQFSRQFIYLSGKKICINEKDRNAIITLSLLTPPKEKEKELSSLVSLSHS